MLDIKSAIVSVPEIIQNKLLESNEFSTFIQKYGLFINKQYLIGLWNIGLLQADLIYSDSPLNIDGLVCVQNNNNEEYKYVDNRKQVIKSEGWGSSLTKETEILKHAKLYFHPFRYYVLYNTERIFGYKIHALQYFLDIGGAHRIVDSQNNWLNSWTSKEEFIEKVVDWNKAISLVVFVEPWAYEKIFNKIRWQIPGDIKSVIKKINSRFVLINNVFRDIGIDEIERIRKQLCIDVELLDENKILHILVRMMNANVRENLKGHIGGSMLLFTMAEMLRLAAENTFDMELKEEDELGFGVWMKDVKKKMYGANRLYDATHAVKNEFMRQYGFGTCQQV